MKRPPEILRELDHRDDLPEFLNRHRLVGEGVEVGTYVGSYAKTILEKWMGRKLYLVDPYKKYPKAEYFDSTQDVDQAMVYLEARNNLERFRERAQFMRMESLKAALLFEDYSLSFVYLDGNHKYESVVADMDAWYPKISSGGVFSGHDLNCRQRDTNSDALNAVLDYAEAVGVRPHVTWDTSWWFIKP